MRKLIRSGRVAAIAVIAIVVVWKLMHRGGGDPSPSAATGSGGSAMKLRRANGPAAPASIAGRVTNKADGKGIAGAIVSITSSDLLAELKTATPTIVAVADASGAFLAPNVPPGGYVVAATAIGFLPGRSGKIWLGAGEQESDIAIALDAGGTLVKGSVTDIGGGPINGARITMKQGNGLDWKRTEFVATSGNDGTYQISLADGEYSATASHDDYTHVEHDVSVAGKPVTRDFVLTPGGVIRGVVIAKDSKQPVPRALVTASHHGRGFGDGMPTTAADDGTFVIRSLRPGAIALSAQGKGYASSSPTTVELGIGETADNVRIMVDRAYSISGTVTRAGTQQGVDGIRLGAFSMAGGSVGLAPDPTDVDGVFEIVGLRPGNYTLFAFGEHAVPEIGKTVEIVDKDVTGVKIEISAGVKLSGHVEPPQVASLSLEMAGEVGLANIFQALKTVMVRADSDASGAFTLENVPPGAFKIVARTTAGPNGTTNVVVGDKDQTGLVVKLEPRASIAGRVLDTNNNPVAGAEVEAEIIDDDKHSNMRMSFGRTNTSAQTAADGAYKIVGLDAGKYRMVVAGDRDERLAEMIADKKDPKRKHVEVELQATSDKTGVDLTVEARDGVIRGQVIGSDRQPALDTWITAYREPDKDTAKMVKSDDDEAGGSIRWWAGSEPVLTNADGKFIIGKLKKGTYTLVAEGPRGSSHAQKAGVKTGDSVTIELRPLGTLTGKVALGGAPVASYSIECHGPTGETDRQVSAADGAYELEHLAPGTYTCSVEADNGTAKGTATVPPGAATLDLALVPWASLTGRVVSMFDGKPVPKINALTSGMGKSTMVDIMQGTAPTTDANGVFDIQHVGAGSGTIMLMQPTAGFEPLATHPYVAKDGQKTDVGVIKIVPPRQGDAGTLGMAVAPDGPSSLNVMSVKAGGPAEAAGIVVGDKITTIDGHTVAELTPLQSAAFLASGHIGIGETVSLGVQHASGDPTTVTITSVKW